jgi:hypothetical protein
MRKNTTFKKLKWINVMEDNAWSLKKDEMGKVWWWTKKTM